MSGFVIQIAQLPGLEAAANNRQRSLLQLQKADQIHPGHEGIQHRIPGLPALLTIADDHRKHPETHQEERWRQCLSVHLRQGHLQNQTGKAEAVQIHFPHQRRSAQELQI